MDSHLKGRDFIVGGHVTLADFDLAAPLSQMSRSGVVLSATPHVNYSGEQHEAYSSYGKTIPAQIVNGFVTGGIGGKPAGVMLDTDELRVYLKQLSFHR
jgi:hypothetical protein